VTAPLAREVRRPGLVTCLQAASVGGRARKGSTWKGRLARVGLEGRSPTGGRDDVTRTARRRATSVAPDGDREVLGCARGLFWLQKSTSGAGSVPSGTGLAPTPHAREGNFPARFCLAQRGALLRQRGEEASWLTRGGNVAGLTGSSCVHAASVPRVRTAAMPCGRAGSPRGRADGPRKRPSTRRREPSAMEGVLVQRRRSSLTRRRPTVGLAARRRGPASPRGNTRRGRAAAAGRDRGRQRSRHDLGSRSTTPWPGGAARRSYRSKLHQDRAAPSS